MYKLTPLSAVVFFVCAGIVLAALNASGKAVNVGDCWEGRDYRGEMDLEKAVIHHTAGNKEQDKDLTVKQIDDYHKSKGWNGCGYHFVIRKNGKVFKGRPIYKQGAHAKGRNHYIGIALTGYSDFTEAQVRELIRLLKALGVKHIERHHEECPGPGLDLATIRKEIK